MPVLLKPMLTDRAASRDISIDYLRGFATVLVLAIHCSAPYTHLTQGTGTASWQSPVPIIDTRASSSLDYMLTLLDASVMSLMFFISGLFVLPGLRAKGVSLFLRDRLFRLGLPFAGMALLAMPLAYYASWSMAHPGGSLMSFWMVCARAHFPAGPGWFLWLLLFFDCVVGLLYLLAADVLLLLATRLRSLRLSPGLFALGMMMAGLLLYVPLALRYGGIWLTVVTPPFMLQPSRTLYYAAWFFGGLLVGGSGLKEGLLARDGRLARSPLPWGLLGLIGGNALWFGVRALGRLELSPLEQGLTLSLLWVLADTGICVALLALFRGRIFERRIWADSLARHAYSIYVLHYIFALGLERLLLRAPLAALAKFAITLSVTLALSWLVAVLWLRFWHAVTLLGGRAAGQQHAAVLKGVGSVPLQGRGDSAA